ncbi:MAG TPA: CoA-binding protein [Saprospiraceae bacterium]|nr:CoA-binding protein [Saprospiraceae bacterium]
MKDGKLTLVVGASENPARYSNIATKRLLAYGHPVIAYGLKKGFIEKEAITTVWPETNDIDTVTLYVGPSGQEDLYQKVIDLHPKRVIFNPGTENEVFYKKLNEAGISYLEACTLVLLSVGDY